MAMNRRQDAMRFKQNSKSLKLQGNLIKVAWAPGKGMKGKEFKDFWDVDLGVSYIPYENVHENADLELVEEGGMLDEDTIPPHIQGTFLFVNQLLILLITKFRIDRNATA